MSKRDKFMPPTKEELSPLETNGVLPLQEGGRYQSETATDLDKLKADNQALASQLAISRLLLKQSREERCLDALQVVLEKHKCKLTPLPNGQFQVTAQE